MRISFQSLRSSEIQVPFSKQLAAISALEYLCPNRYPREQLLKNICTSSSVIETIIPSDGIPITQGRIDLMDSKEGGSSKDDWYQKV
jgi:hypothetical protein